jgi:hypothetical protein
MKIKNLTSVICVGIWVLSAGCTNQESNTPVPASSTDSPLPVVSTEVVPTLSSVRRVSVLAMEQFATSEIQTQLVNNVEISVANFRYEQDSLLVEVCHQSPDAREWTIGEAVVQIGGHETLLFRSTNVQIKNVLDNGQREIISYSIDDQGYLHPVSKFVTDDLPGHRCDRLQFRTGVLQGPMDLVLTIKYVNAIPPEGEQGPIEIVSGPWVFTGTVQGQ